MLSLESPRWDGLEASGGGSGALTASLLRRAADGDEEAFDELYNEVCHQNSVGEVAYYAAPHLVAISRTAAPRLRALMLGIVGSIVASRECYGRSAAAVPHEASAEFVAAVSDARQLVAESLQDTWAPESAIELIAAMAAFQGHADLSMFLQTGPELSCPSCGEAIEFRENVK